MAFSKKRTGGEVEGVSQVGRAGKRKQTGLISLEKGD